MVKKDPLVLPLKVFLKKERLYSNTKISLKIWIKDSESILNTTGLNRVSITETRKRQPVFPRVLTCSSQIFTTLLLSNIRLLMPMLLSSMETKSINGPFDTTMPPLSRLQSLRSDLVSFLMNLLSTRWN